MQQVTQERANQMFQVIMEMGLPGTQDEVWAVFVNEKFD